MKSSNIDLHKKIGVLGGGQLGRMLQEKALAYGVDLFFLDNDIKAPCSIFKNNFVHGSFRDYNAVIQFGKDKQILTIEIEHVNIEALEQLSKYGIEIIPSVGCIKMIKNKALQKQFYEDHQIPTSPFTVVNTHQIPQHIAEKWYPFVQKTQLDGYDGKGVAVIQQPSDLSKQLNDVSIIEKKLEIKKELATTIAIDKSGKVFLYPICEMVFNPKLNLVDYLIAPADIDEKTEKKIITISKKIAKALNTYGVFSIEFFLTEKNEVLVNEMAPRAHNSAHYTIEGCNISQYEAQLRILLNMPLQTIELKGYAGMVNLIGEQGYTGLPLVKNLNKLDELENAYIHLYGKKETKPGRKMGHITLLNKNKSTLIKQLKWVKENILVVSN